MSQIPSVFHSRLSVLHDGIDTGFFKPTPEASRKIGNLDLSDAKEILTYATRGMDPYRGFPEFMRAAAKLMEKRPNLHAVVVGEDCVAYGKKLPKGAGWGKRLVEELKPDTKRMHFTGPLSYADYLRVLQFSAAQAYLTVPFVLSWSLIESLSAGVLVIASDTAPVREVITHDENGFLADFFDTDAFVAQIESVLDTAKDLGHIRENARQTVIDTYAHKTCYPAS